MCTTGCPVQSLAVRRLPPSLARFLAFGAANPPNRKLSEFEFGPDQSANQLLPAPVWLSAGCFWFVAFPGLRSETLRRAQGRL